MAERSATGNGLTTWVIYDHPADFPAHFVVRPWTVVGGGRIEPGSPQLCGSLEQARALMEARGLYRLDRQPDDDPAIAEVWL